MYATQSDNFRNVRDIENTFCKAAEHAFNRDGDVSNKSYIGVKVQPNELIKERFGDIPITKHKKLDKISNNDEDITYQVNDVVFCATSNSYGRIRALYEIEAEKWVELTTWKNILTDEESRIQYCDIDETANTEILLLNEVSNPLVTGIDDGKIWFVSANITHIPWLSQHLSN